MINVELERGGTENSNGVLRRFTKRVQESGIVNRVRGLRYYKRTASKNSRKKQTIAKLIRKTATEKAIKLGKIRPTVRGKR